MTRESIVCAMAYAGALVVTSNTAIVAQTVTIASAEMGAAGQDNGVSITPAQFVAWRFEIDEALAVESVGGHLWSDPFQLGEIFAALVRLSSIDAVPQGTPFSDEELVAATTFRADFPSSERQFPLSATLIPGSYALVFGTGLFGATGYGALPNSIDQPDIPPTNLSSFIFWSAPAQGAPLEWRRNLASHMRVVIEAQVINLPGDYDHDGSVDAQDYAVWKQNFGSTSALAADGNGNSIVDAADYTIWRDHLEGGGTGAAVPEPAAMGLLTFAAAWAMVVGSRMAHRVADSRRRLWNSLIPTRMDLSLPRC